MRLEGGSPEGTLANGCDTSSRQNGMTVESFAVSSSRSALYRGRRDSSHFLCIYLSLLISCKLLNFYSRLEPGWRQLYHFARQPPSRAHRRNRGGEQHGLCETPLPLHCVRSRDLTGSASSVRWTATRSRESSQSSSRPFSTSKPSLRTSSNSL